jgi:hypothetical protein
MISLVIGISCDTEQSPDVAYIEIPAMNVVTNSSQGAPTSALTTLWIEQNGQDLGAFLPPCRIPVYAGENQTLRFIPGVDLNGSYSIRNQYEMLETKSKTFSLSSGAVKSIPEALMTFSYKESIDFIVVEDFEDVGLSLQETAKSTVNLTSTNNPSEIQPIPAGNSRSGKVVLPPVNLAEFKSIETYDLPKYGANVWVELDYKTDIPLTVGIVANELLQSVQAPVVTLFPTAEWNKIYINLVSEVSAYPNSGDYNLFIGAVNTSDTDTAHVYFDNFKLLY